MSKKRSSGSQGQRSDPAWVEAKRLCRLSQRHIEMAKKLGMSPKTLLKLRPSPSQKWKLPVREFIEECFRKRFPSEAAAILGDPLEGELTPRPPPSNQRGPSEPRTERPPRYAASKAEDLVVYLANLFDDLEATLAAGAITNALFDQHRE